MARLKQNKGEKQVIILLVWLTGRIRDGAIETFITMSPSSQPPIRLTGRIRDGAIETQFTAWLAGVAEGGLTGRIRDGAIETVVSLR